MKILCVDDEERVQILLKNLLEVLDYEVDTGGLQRSGNAFYSSVKLLLDGFIVHQRKHGADGN